ncbi:hypothetical protein J6590_104719, partial [Homalodisca vitripennis]
HLSFIELQTVCSSVTVRFRFYKIVIALYTLGVIDSGYVGYYLARSHVHGDFQVI